MSDTVLTEIQIEVIRDLAGEKRPDFTSTAIHDLCASHERLRAQLAEASRDRDALQAELELERRKDHAHNAWKDGYNHAMADYAAGRTVGWPDADRARRALSPGDAE